MNSLTLGVTNSLRIIYVHHRIILPSKMKSYVFQFVGTKKSEEFEVLFFCIAAVEVFFL